MNSYYSERHILKTIYQLKEKIQLFFICDKFCGGIKYVLLCMCDSQHCHCHGAEV